MRGGIIVNSILYFNSAPNSGTGNDENYFGLASITHSIAEPLPGGEGNIAVDPELDADFKPIHGSPAINVGTNDIWMIGTKDLAGYWRIAEGIVDIGAYEYHPPGTVIKFW